MSPQKKVKSLVKGDIVTWQRRIWFLIGVLVLFVVLFYVINILKPILTPFIYAFAIVFILKPVVEFFENKGLPRIWALLLTYLVFILIVTLFLIYIIPVLTDQFRSLITNLPQYVKLIEKKAISYISEISKMKLPFDTEELLKEFLSRLREPGLALFGRIPGFTAGFVSGFFNILIAPILAFYILKDYESIRENLHNLIPIKYRDQFSDIIIEIDEVISNYLKGQVLVSISVGILIVISLTILGIDYALIIGIIGGIFNIIPYLGPIIGAIPAIIIAFFKKPILALWVILLMIIIQQIDSFFISPNIMKKQMNLHPAIVVFSLMIGGLLWGILGMLMAIPIAAAVKAIIMYYVEKSPYYQEEASADESS